MAKKEGRKPLSRRKARLFGLLLLAVACAASCLFALWDLTPTRYDFKAGEPSPETIYAPYAIVDEAATEALVASARENAKRVYAIDEALVSTYVSGGEGFFQALLSMRATALAALPAGTAAPDAEGWKNRLTAQDKAQLCAMTAPALDEDMLAGVLASTPEQIQSLEDVVLSKLSTALEAGLSEDGAASVRASCVREINAMTGFSGVLKQVASVVLDAYMKPTLALDEAATRAAQDEAAAAVTPVKIKKGELIVERGKAVTDEEYAILWGLGLVSTDEPDFTLNAGALIALITCFALYAAYLGLYRKEVLLELKKMLIICVLVVLTVALAFLAGKADARLSPALVAIMLCALLADERAALALTPLMAVTLGIMAA
ncbi:MAG TPA: hypothetical protein VN540_03870, partial [Clostridia bacterium]|nr:hypothetical protein [Clostridia bacterium]